MLFACLPQALNGDDAVDAVNDVIQQQRKRWLGLIARHEQNKDMVEELLSAATLKLLVRAQSGFEQGTNLQAYVHTTVMNVLRTHASSEIARRTDGEVYDHEMFSEESEDSATGMLEQMEDEDVRGRPEDHAARHQLARLLEEALEAVAQRQPQAVDTWRMFCLQELSCEEVASVQGITAAAVSKQVFNVNQALRKNPKAQEAFASLS